MYDESVGLAAGGKDCWRFESYSGEEITRSATRIGGNRKDHRVSQTLPSSIEVTHYKVMDSN